MAKFKVILSDPLAGTSQFMELEETQAAPLVGRKIGEIIDGAIVKLPGYKLKITGGSDKDGFPMRPNIHGGVRIGAILRGGVGFHPTESGERKRKAVRGNVITDAIVQVNMKVVEKPKGKKAEKQKKEAAVEGSGSEEAAE